MSDRGAMAFEWDSDSAERVRRVQVPYARGGADCDKTVSFYFQPNTRRCLRRGMAGVKRYNGVAKAPSRVSVVRRAASGCSQAIGQGLAVCRRTCCALGVRRSHFDKRTFLRDRCMNIYVGNLSYSVTEDDLKDAFAEFGQVSSVSVVTDKFSGQSKGFGFVEMPSNSEADAAIKGLNERDLKGRNLKVNQAKPREERPARRPRY